MFYISFHGGQPTNPIPSPINNICAYDEYGNRLSAGILPGDSSQLSELRGMAMVGGFLYVANGAKSVSNILCFQSVDGSLTNYALVGTFVDGSVNSVDHPFAMAFSDKGKHCYVSNQDTNVISLLDVSADLKTAKAGKLASYLHANFGEKFLEGTLVASSEGSLPKVPATTPVPFDKGGLDVKTVKDKGKRKVQNSVRDVLLVNDILFAVDEPGGYVRMYDRHSGEPLGNSNQLDSPVHLFLYGGVLYVSAKNEVRSCLLPSGSKPSLDFKKVYSDLPGDAAGMSLDTAGNFYVAIRTQNEVVRFAPGSTTPTTWLSGLSDNPEFLFYIPQLTP